MIIIAEVSELTRKIKLPTDRVLSVNGDYQVDGIAFKLPTSYEGDFDFSTGAARVHWTGVDKVEHTNLLTDKDASGRPLWIMPSELTQGGHGVIEFAVSFVATDATAAVTKRWMSDPVSFRNRRTVNGSNEDEEAEEETIYDRLASAIAAVRAAQASVDKVNEVLAGITNSSPVVVAAVADLSGLDVTKHQLAIVRADGYLYYYDGSAWQKGIKYGSYELDTTLTESGKAADAAAVGAEVSAIKEDLSTHEVRITELEDGGSGGLSKTAVNLLNTILSEAVYGSDQSKNITLLYKELSNVKPISITAVLTGRALVGMRYSELTFDITATYDDESTVTVSEGYRVITSGTVHNGSNTVTVRYRGTTTDVTFMAEQVVTHTITYNLTDVSSSNVASVVADGAYYSTTLSVKADYGFNGCTVTMGGVDITETAFGNMEILIAEVAGDVVITASATEYTYLNDLLPTSDIGFTIVQGYRNGTIEGTPMFKQAYNYAPFVSEYPALNDCTIHWSIKNISDSDASLEGCYFGNINPDDISGGISGITAFYCVGAYNSSKSLAPGAGLEGDVTVKGGMQLCFICKNTDFSKFEIKLRGNYVPNTFDGYGEVNPTNSNTSAYGAYRKVTYYGDDGSEVLTSFNGTPRKIAVTLEPGIYDMYCSVQATTITANVRRTRVLIGGMSADTDTTVYYTGHGQGDLNAALWHHSTFKLSDSNMAIISGGIISAMNNTDRTLRIMYKKVVNA